jgi:cell shape-determining protein MreC
MSRLPWRAVMPLAIVLSIVLAVRPVPLVDRVVYELCSPLRFLAQLTWPVRNAAPRPVLAADELLRIGLLEEAASRETLHALHRAVLVEGRGLTEGRRQVPAEVVERASGGPDRIVIRPWTFDGIAPGLPVVHRDAYVGRVSSVDLARGRVEVDLVTARDFFVGARVDAADAGGPVSLVVGGLAVEARGAAEPRTWLAAHNPSRPPREGSAVRVGELLPELDSGGGLAEGYLLGRLERGANDGDWRVRPVLDFLHGLYHVVVLTDGGPRSTDPVPPLHPLEEDRWVRARALTAGDPSPWRESHVLDVGRSAGVQPGAAVVSGARLVGRAGPASALGAVLHSLADPGLSIPAVGRPVEDPDAEPRVLGRLVSLGRRTDGGILFHWRDVTLAPVSNGEAPPPPVRMRLFTGSGESGLPAGLLLGEALMPMYSSEGRGHRIVLEGERLEALLDQPLWVRVEHRDAREVGE